MAVNKLLKVPAIPYWSPCVRVLALAQIQLPANALSQIWEVILQVFGSLSPLDWVWGCGLTPRTVVAVEGIQGVNQQTRDLCCLLSLSAFQTNVWKSVVPGTYTPVTGQTAHPKRWLHRFELF